MSVTAAACIGLLPLGTGAQAVRRVPLADSPTVERNIFRRLFQGIALSDSQRKRAEEIIHGEDQAQRALTGPMPICEKWPKRIALNARRDSALRALLTTHADSMKFDANSPQLRPEPLPAGVCK